jgi:hydrogenase expression/formation protein HypC
MCLAVPGRITSIHDEGPLRMGTVDFGGVTSEVCLAYVPEAVVGSYVIVHVGFAISQLDEREALETLRLFRELGGAGRGPAEADA